MRKNLGPNPYVYPQPVLIVSRPMPANFSLPVTDFEPESHPLRERRKEVEDALGL